MTLEPDPRMKEKFEDKKLIESLAGRFSVMSLHPKNHTNKVKRLPPSAEMTSWAIKEDKK